jgi:chaperonin cofactor prefoldin
MRLPKALAVMAVSIGVGLGVSVAAQGAGAPDVLGALLTEVRGLRVAMEQMASAGPRVQLALGRLQLQEQRLNTMIRRAETVRDSIVGAEKVHTEMQARSSSIDMALKRGDMPAEERDQMSHMAEGLKKSLTSAGLDVQRLQADEAQLQQQIASEQTRWADINRTLEDLERTLGRR